MDKHLHIVCHDIPYPVDYGGVFDLFHKLISLFDAGVKIHLHCFEYGRARQNELNKYCTTVQYYERTRGLGGVTIGMPYIVSSRKNPELLENLLKDNYPVLLEGIHCSFLLHDERFTNRSIILRLHNVEYVYYRQLAKTTRSVWKQLYYSYESNWLYKYEKSIAQKVIILCVSEQDLVVYQNEFHADNIYHLPVFLPYHQVSCAAGVGSYCLYHGNLSVPENEKAALWLLEEVFKELDTSFVIAGKNPSGTLEKAITKNINSCLVANPSEEELQDLIGKAQINVLPSFNNTGVKLKVLNALFTGRHCIINEASAHGTTLTKACHISTTADDMKGIIKKLFHQPFTEKDVTQRKLLIEGIYSNSTNVRQLIQWIW